jgi:hypothetical protein
VSVADLLGPGEWSIEEADGGGSIGHSWIATDGARRYFVKDRVNTELLRSLANLGVAPAVVADEDDTIVQEFVRGVSPAASWIDEQIDSLGKVIKRYQDASDLTNLVQPLTHKEYVAYLSQRAETVESDPLRACLQAVAKKAIDDDRIKQTLTHGDPNASNWILRPDGGLCLVDWDDARTSDPMRDIGPLVWWYVPPMRWRAAVITAGYPFDSDVRDSIFWWAAARSIDVALWLSEHAQLDRATEFAEDAQAAIRGQANPRGWWLN